MAVGRGFTVTISPAFKPEEIVESTLGVFWRDFQSHAYIGLPEMILIHMKQFINAGRKRAGGTGNLANAMTIYRDPDTKAHVHWGIGHIPTLMAQAPYYYVVNYGTMYKTDMPFIPGKGAKADGYRPISFGGEAPYGGLRGGAPKGSPRANLVKKITGERELLPSPIRPSNFIEKTVFKLHQEINNLMTKIRSI